MSRQLHREEYTVGWICALPVELAAAQEMLDEEHDDLDRDLGDNDENLYALGSIGGHNVAIVCLPAGRIGNNPAAAIAIQMRATFKGIQFGLMVGIGGGVPSAEVDIRLGDVVVSQPDRTFGGVVQYDFGKTTPSGFERMGSLNSPPQILLSAVARVRANELRGKSKVSEHIAKLDRIPKFQRSNTTSDVLYEATYDHKGGQMCYKCSLDRQEARQPRNSEEVVVHYGTIASGNQVIKNAAERDKVSAELGGILCFEMEAAGLMNNFPCLIIRGICDYADSHKNKSWQAYAAGAAAACAKEMLLIIPPVDVAKARTAEEAIRGSSKSNLQPLESRPVKRRKFDSSDDFEDKLADPRLRSSPRGPFSPQEVSSQKLSPQQQDCLRSLSFPEQEYRYNDIHTAKDTCEWLLQDPQYQVWMNSPRGLFWIKGNPGTGKSVLMKFAVRELQKAHPGKLILSFFIHGQGRDLQKTPLGIFRALLNSILDKFPAYLNQLTAKFEDREKRFGGYEAGRWKWPDEELQEVLSEVLTSETQHQPVIIFVDALDECGEIPATNLLAYFKDLAKREKAQVKICVSSRHYPILGLDTIPSIFVEERNGKDIRWYTRDRLKDIRSEQKPRQIEKEILSKARGGFQWVFLVTEMVRSGNLKGIRMEKVQEMLASSPETLSELYAAILRGVPKADQRQMVKLFQWVLFAQRPLSAQELRDALATDCEMSCSTVSELRTHDSWSDTLADFERHVKHISRGLVQFRTREIWEQYELDGEDSDREAQLIHQSVADYLLDRFLGSLEYGQHISWSIIGAGHFQISRSCFRYLTLTEVLEGARLSRGTLSSRFPLAPYATRFLFKHIQKVEEQGVCQSDLLSLIQWAPQSDILTRLDNLWRILNPDRVETPVGWPFIGATAFHVLAGFGSGGAFNKILEENDEEVDCRDSNGNTPLLVAITGGHQDIALTLLDRFNEWQLHYKRESGQSQSNVEDQSTGCQGCRFVDVNAENKDGETALTIALIEGAENVVFKLIEAGADVNSDDALIEASRLGLATVVNLLLSHGASATVRNERGNFPLMVATENGHEEVVRSLIQYAPLSAEMKDEEGHTALNRAFEHRQLKLIILLLKEGSYSTPSPVLEQLFLDLTRVNDVDFNIDTLISLSQTAASGEEGVVQRLIHTGKVNVNAKDINGQTLLFLAAINEHEAILQLLLDTGKVDVDATTYGRTPLSWAACKGHKAMLKMLLDTGKADVEVKDIHGRTLLGQAAENKHEEVVRMLLDTGKVNVDVKDIDGRTPLWKAAENGHKVIVKMLLDTGKVDVNVRDIDGRTPLRQAAENMHEEIVKMLLDTGKVDMSAKDIDEWTPQATDPKFVVKPLRLHVQ